MIRSSTLIAARGDVFGVEAAPVMLSPSLEGLGNIVYELSWIKKLWYYVKFSKKYTYRAEFYVDDNYYEAAIELMNDHGLAFRTVRDTFYDINQFKILLTDDDMVMVKLST